MDSLVAVLLTEAGKLVSGAEGEVMATAERLRLTPEEYGKIKIRFDSEALIKSAAASILIAITVITAETLRYDRLLLPAYILLGAATYTLASRALKAAKPEDIKLIRNYLGPRLSFLPDLATKLLRPK